MSIHFFRDKVRSFVGDVFPLWLDGDRDLVNKRVDWSVRGDCAVIRQYTPSGDGFYHGVLVTLVAEGEARITASCEGQEIVAEVSAYRTPTAKPERMNFYTADLHNHTTLIHEHDQLSGRVGDLQSDYVDYVKRAADIDLTVISDHAGVIDDAEFFRGFVEVDKAADIYTVILPGCESEVLEVETDRYGQTVRTSGEIVTLNADNYADAVGYPNFFSRFNTSPFSIAVLAHPQIIGYHVPGMWNFSLHKHRQDRLSEMVKLIEVGNGDHMRQSNLVNEFVYSVALDNGFRVGCAASSDSHCAPWGKMAAPGKTVVLAKEKSKEAFIDALRAGRCYASDSGDLKVYYEVNGRVAPTELDLTDTYRFHVEVGTFSSDESALPVRCRVFSDYGKVVAEYGREDYSSFDFTVKSDSARWFYLRFEDSKGRKTLSVPVYCSRPIDRPISKIAPIDKKTFKAKDLISGTVADALVCDDVHVEWHTPSSTADILIDMGIARRICALGHYPPIITRERGIVAVSMASLACEYEIYTSVDGVHFTKITDGTVRSYGGETVFPFDETEARYLRFFVKSNVGDFLGYSDLSGLGISIAELTVFEKGQEDGSTDHVNL